MTEPRGIPEVMLRTAAAVALLIVGSILIYGFGAGYFSSITIAGVPVGLPTPWNVVAAVVLGVGLLSLVMRIFGLRPRLEHEKNRPV